MAESTRPQRLIVEGAVIVVSILLAFGIDAWWDARQARMEERAMLVAVREEAERNRAELYVMLDRNRTQREAVDRFLRATPDELVTVVSDSVGLWFAALYVPWTFDPELSAATNLLGLPRSSSPARREVRRLLARWIQLLEDAGEEKEAMRDLANGAASLVAAASTSQASGGLDMISEVAARGGPEFLGRIREEPSFIASVMSMSQQQAIYLDELGDASVLLDSLRVVLRSEQGS